ncbi:hypothetical protein QBC47DRAFT_354760 [Echria macrotheca]|uniref:Uncharacterized protein n=1 Tax=Echria macrotheca TaxID=438768 RepID=A0AAJ0F5X8_9PEZI|nr:hypothetical protein QBC47DRAFT_354760 [Echria macrotheca]
MTSELKHKSPPSADSEKRVSTRHRKTLSRTTASTHEPSSLHSILRDNETERLYTHPLQWSSRHLQLINCQFVRRTLNPKSTVTGRKRPLEHPTDVKLAGLSEQAIDRASRYLRQNCTTESKNSTVRQLLRDHGIDQHSPTDDLQLPFCFNQRQVALLPTDGIFCNSSGQIVLAYLHLSTVKERRNPSIRPRRHARVQTNIPTTRLKHKAESSPRPTGELEDPYIAAVLIALAQQRRSNQHTTTLSGRNQNPERPTSPSGSASGAGDYLKVYVLVLPENNLQGLYFYSARVFTTFLDRFEQPSRELPRCSLVISYHRVPFGPKEMIGAMGRVIVAVRGNLHVEEAGAELLNNNT